MNEMDYPSKDVLFSIIVPVYNIEEYLGKCVKSILGNTYRNLELILVDDGSPDGCPRMCDAYAEKDKRVRVIHKENGGLVSARQAGVEIAVGDYVVCVDGDDWVAKNYLELYHDIIAKHNPDIICTGYVSAKGAVHTMHRLEYPLGYYDKKKIIEVIYPILIEDKNGCYFRPQIWAKAFKRSLYKQQQQVDSLVSVGEDHACSKPCIYHAASMYLAEDCPYYYRINPESMTNKRKPFFWGGPKSIGQHFEKQIDMSEYDFQEQVYRNVVHNVFNVAVSQFNQEKGYLEIKREIGDHLKDDYYDKCIRRCKYKSLNGRLAKIALQYRLYFLMYFYNKKGR